MYGTRRFVTICTLEIFNKTMKRENFPIRRNYKYLSKYIREPHESPEKLTVFEKIFLFTYGDITSLRKESSGRIPKNNRKPLERLNLPRHARKKLPRRRLMTIHLILHNMPARGISFRFSKSRDADIIQMT